MIEKGRNFFAVHKFSIALALILLLAFGLRIWGIGFGLPNLYHPDEDAVVMPALNIIKTGDLEPTRMEYGSLHIYLLTAVSAMLFALSARNGKFSGVEQIPIYERGTYPLIYDFPEFFIGARLLSVIMGIAVVVVIFLLARRLGGERQAFISIIIAAILPPLVIYSHFATTDTALMFWITLGLYLIIRSYDNWDLDTMWAYAGAGFICGLAASTKYNGILLLIPLMLVPLMRVKSLDNMLSARVFAGPFFMVIGFLIGTPYALLNIPKFLFWLGYSLRLYNAPRDLTVSPLQFHLEHHLTSSHATVFFLGFVGFFLSFWVWGKRGVIVNSFGFMVWVSILSQTNLQPRMWLPSAPLVVLWASLTIDFVISKMSGRLSKSLIRPYREYVIFAPIIFLFFFLLLNSLKSSASFRAQDIRTVTQIWIQENIPPGTPIVVDYFGPNLDINAWPVQRMFNVMDQDINWYQEQGVRYFVISELMRDQANQSSTSQHELRELLDQVCLIKALTGPFRSDPGKVWEIYQIPPCEE